jgi:glucose-6-phosphate isomerase
LTHQRIGLVPYDFIAFARPRHLLDRRHDILMANVFAQAEAPAFGKTSEQAKVAGAADWLVPHRCFEGSRPSSTILAECLTPGMLGKPAALRKHAFFNQGAIRQINRFDQWGVELGQALALLTTPESESSAELQLGHHSSANRMIRRYCRMKEAS